jgi:hypothetical protein
MRRYVFLLLLIPLTACAWVQSTLGLSPQTITPNQALYAIEGGYGGVVAATLAYAQEPKCGVVHVNCHDPAVLAKAATLEHQTSTAIDAAKLAVAANPSGSGVAGAIATANSALTALVTFLTTQGIVK